MQNNWQHISLEGYNLVCVRGGRRVYEGLGFTLKSGELLVLRGGNGSGKSTLLRQIAGFLPVYEGQINCKHSKEQTLLDANLHYVGHQSGVKTYLSVAENLSYWSQLFEGSDVLDDTLSFWGLNSLRDTPARLLSEGQKRRVGLARLMLAPRPIWLLDEPNVGLDVENLARLEQAISAHIKAGGMAMMASHVEVAIKEARELNLSTLSNFEGASV